MDKEIICCRHPSHIKYNFAQTSLKWDSTGSDRTINNKIISTRGGTIKWRRKVPRKCDAMHSDTGLRINPPLLEMRAKLYQTNSARVFLWKFQETMTMLVQMLWNVLVKAMRFWKECRRSPQAMTTKRKKKRKKDRTGLLEVCRTVKRRKKEGLSLTKEERKKKKMQT